MSRSTRSITPWDTRRSTSNRNLKITSILFPLLSLQQNNLFSMFDKNEQLTRQHTARWISIEKSKDTVHQLFREIVTQLSSSFLLQRDQFRRWHRVYAITLRNEVISVRNNARACSQNRGARKGPLARTINAKRWSDPTNGTRSERTNRSQFVTIGTCTSLSFETATSCVPSPLPHHPRSPFYADPEH